MVTCPIPLIEHGFYIEHGLVLLSLTYIKLPDICGFVSRLFMFHLLYLSLPISVPCSLKSCYLIQEVCHFTFTVLWSKTASAILGPWLWQEFRVLTVNFPGKSCWDLSWNCTEYTIWVKKDIFTSLMCSLI